MTPRTYTTAQLARLMGVHPNTVRFYEQMALVPPAARRPNGYRVFYDAHAAQFHLARSAFSVELLQRGLRKQAVEIVKTSARGDFAAAIALAEAYRAGIRSERTLALEVIGLTREMLRGKSPAPEKGMTRKDAAERLGVTVETLRNWERNHLLVTGRKEKGVRLYDARELRELKIIRILRSAGYSLSSILRLMRALERDVEADVARSLNTPHADEEIISACDRLLASLDEAEDNAENMPAQLREMQEIENANPTV